MEEIARRVDRILLLESGRIAMDGSPAKVFTESRRLTELGLAPPKASMIAARLRALGLPVKQGIYTMEQLKQELLELKAQSVE
jgi:energy-coupling factor transport system ATP-binding protein